MNNWEEYPGRYDPDYPLGGDSPHRWGAYWHWDKGWVLALPHQCDAWRIGTEEGAKALIADLEQLVKDGPPSEPPAWA